MTIHGLVVLQDADPRLVFRAVDAKIAFGQELLDGHIFLARRRSEIAACIEVEDDWGGRLRRLADEGKLHVAVDTEERAGLTVVSRVWVYAGQGGHGDGVAWVTGRGRDLLPSLALDWRAHILVAAVGGRPASAMPRSSARPRGQGAPLELRLVGEVDERVARLPERIEQAGDRSIAMTINSNGGRYYLAREIFDRLVAHPHEVTARVLNAQSAAAMVALGADVRTIAPDATFMLHRPVLADFEGADADDLRRHADMLDGIERDITGITAIRTGLDFDIVADWVRKGAVFNAGQAVTCGLADAVDLDVVPAKSPPRRVKTQAIAGPFESLRPATRD